MYCLTWKADIRYTSGILGPLLNVKGFIVGLTLKKSRELTLCGKKVCVINKSTYLLMDGIFMWFQQNGSIYTFYHHLKKIILFCFYNSSHFNG